jgi:hypothetical protein
MLDYMYVEDVSKQMIIGLGKSLNGTLDAISEYFSKINSITIRTNEIVEIISIIILESKLPAEITPPSFKIPSNINIYYFYCYMFYTSRSIQTLHYYNKDKFTAESSSCSPKIVKGITSTTQVRSIFLPLYRAVLNSFIYA